MPGTLFRSALVSKPPAPNQTSRQWEHDASRTKDRGAKRSGVDADRAAMRGRYDQSGQALIETGIVIVFLVILLTGIVEFGRAWMIINMITHALRDGARAAAIAPGTNRVDGLLDGATISAIQSRVLSDIQSVMDPATLDAPTVTQSVANGIPVVTVGVTGSVPYVFGFLGNNFAVNRSVTFRDEGR